MLTCVRNDVKAIPGHLCVTTLNEELDDEFEKLFMLVDKLLIIFIVREVSEDMENCSDILEEVHFRD